MSDNPKKRVLDFTNVKDASQFNPRRIPAGDYKCKVVSVEEGESKSGNAQWIFAIQPAGVRSMYPYYCSFEDKALWKIRNLLIAAGIDVPKKRVGVDPNKIVGKTIGASFDDDEYEGKAKSTIVAVFPASEVTSTPDLKKSSKAAAEDDEDEDEVDEDEMEEMDVEDL